MRCVQLCDKPRNVGDVVADSVTAVQQNVSMDDYVGVKMKASIPRDRLIEAL